MDRKRSIFLVCTGLGIVQRGFETYIASLAEKLQSEETSYRTLLYTGGRHQSNSVRSIQLFCISRNNRFWNFLFGNNIVFELELMSFFCSLVIEIVIKKPTAIYLGEYNIYCYLYKIRKYLKLKFSLILYTGGQAIPGLYDVDKDFVHHVTDVYYNDLVDKGYPKERQFVLPHFISLSENDHSLTQIQLPSNSVGKKIIISVGMIDSNIKRMDKFVKVLSTTPQKYFPVLLGEATGDTPTIISQLETSFGKNNFFLGKVNRNELFCYLNQAHLFMLLSPKESFGLAAVEALSVGLPVICCDFAESRYVLKNMGTLIDCKEPQKIKHKVDEMLAIEPSETEIQKRIDFVHNNYSWTILGNKYLRMFECFATDRTECEF